jgi:exodeoxyribonuclease V
VSDTPKNPKSDLASFLAEREIRERMFAELRAKTDDEEVPDMRAKACAPKPMFRVLSQGLDAYASLAPRSVVLSQDQQTVFDAFNRWWASDRLDIFSIGGYAGTGKSTLIGYIAQSLQASGFPIQKIAFAAYTGKASNVLRQKLAAEGVRGGFRGTIHSLIYAVMAKCSMCGALLTENNSAFHQDKLWHLEVGHPPHVSSVGTIVWERKPTLNNECGLIVIDEASMVNDALLDDLTGYHVPILAVGDHGQLPPVSGVSRLMVNPTVKLDKIHRQAETNDIIRLSRGIRETGGWPPGFSSSPNIHLVLQDNLEGLLRKLYEENNIADVCMITYRNVDRIRLNEIARRVRYGVESASKLPPQPGDQLICLKNTQRTIYNGMRGFLKAPGVETMKDYWWRGVVQFPEDRLEVDGWMLKSQFNRDRTYEKPEDAGLKTWGWDPLGMLFDYGYALTGHKAQGSQFKHVIVYHDKPRLVETEMWKRWLYTSVTRASEHMYLLVD